MNAYTMIISFQDTKAGDRGFTFVANSTSTDNGLSGHTMTSDLRMVVDALDLERRQCGVSDAG